MKGRRSHRGSTRTVPGRAVFAGDQGERLRLRLGPAVAAAGRQGALGRRDRAADRAGVREPARDPRGGGLVARAAREDDGVPAEPRRLRGDERGLRAARRRHAAGALDGRGREASVRRARRDRGDRTRRRVTSRSRSTSGRSASDAYVVGGAVRDELLGRRLEGRGLPRPGRRHRRAARGARAARRRRGARRRRARRSACGSTRATARSAQLVPRRHRARAAAPRACRPGPGRHDFEIVVDPTATVEDDLARRDFTINAMARRLDDGDARRSVRRRAGPRRRACCAPSRRTASPRIRCGSCAGCGSSRSSTSTPTTTTLAADARGGAGGAPRLGRADRRRARGRRDGRALEAAARRAARRRRCGSRATRACSCSCCRSSSRRSGSSRRAATTR